MSLSASAFQVDNANLRILDPAIYERRGRIHSVLFDFDGTLSVLRQGWEDVMAPLMLEWISPDQPPSAALEAEVREYIDRSTGILTIQQMEWLVGAVERYGMAGLAHSAVEYKQLYLEKLGAIVKERTDRLACGECQPGDMMIEGSIEFLEVLSSRSLFLYLASGSDHLDVVREARILGLEPYFLDRIFGALDDREAHDKARIIRRIMDDNDLHGDELLVVGDGPVEIREGNRHGALTLGVTSDEVARQGWNEHKVRRLTDAGATLLTSDFKHFQGLVDFLLPSG